MSKFRFKLDPAIVSASILSPVSSSPFSGFSFSTFQSNTSAHTTTPPATKFGDYSYDLAKGKYNLKWASMDEIKAWLRAEEEKQIIKLRRKETKNRGGAWLKKHVYVCTRQGTGGKKKYEKNIQSGSGKWRVNDPAVPVASLSRHIRISPRFWANIPIIIRIPLVMRMHDSMR
jgi:hypothetical protein